MDGGKKIKCFEWDMIPCVPTCNNPGTSSSLNSSTHEDNPTSDNGSESSENVSQDLEWDTSPSQYALHSTPHLSTNTSYPPPLMDIQIPSPYISQQDSTPTPRARMYGTSSNQLQRQNAFRSPRHDEAFLHSQSLDTQQTPTLPQDEPNHMAPRKSRIPKPTSPSDVNLMEVADFSLVPDPLQPPLRRSTRQASRTYYSTTRNNCTRNQRRRSNHQEEEDQEIHRRSREEDIRSITQALTDTQLGRMSARTNQNK